MRNHEQDRRIIARRMTIERRKAIAVAVAEVHETYRLRERLKGISINRWEAIFHRARGTLQMP